MADQQPTRDEQACEFCAVEDHLTCLLDDPDDNQMGQHCCCGYDERSPYVREAGHAG